MQRQHLALARRQRRRRLARAAARTPVRPLPTACTAAATASALESLETNPEAPAACAAWGEIQPAPEISSTRVDGRLAPQRRRTARRPSARRGTGPPAPRGARSGASARAPPRVAGGQAALDPRLLGQQQAEAPVHDVVVVHHQHPQARRARSWLRHQQPHPPLPPSPGPNSTDAAALARASSAASRRPMPAPGPDRPTAAPSLSHLQDEGPVGRPPRSRSIMLRAGVLVGVAQRLGQHRLGQRLQLSGHLDAVLP